MDSPRKTIGVTLAWSLVVFALAAGITPGAGADHLLPTDGLIDSRCDNHSCSQVRLDDVADGGNPVNLLDTVPDTGNPGLGIPDKLVWGAQAVCLAGAALADCITAVGAGSGLVGGGTAGDVTLSVDTAVIQSRVTGTCAVGSFVRVINQDGTVVCGDSGLDYALLVPITSIAGTGVTIVSMPSRCTSNFCEIMLVMHTDGNIGDLRQGSLRQLGNNAWRSEYFDGNGGGINGDSSGGRIIQSLGGSCTVEDDRGGVETSAIQWILADDGAGTGCELWVR